MVNGDEHFLIKAENDKTTNGVSAAVGFAYFLRGSLLVNLNGIPIKI